MWSVAWQVTNLFFVRLPIMESWQFTVIFTSWCLSSVQTCWIQNNNPDRESRVKYLISVRVGISRKLGNIIKYHEISWNITILPGFSASSQRYLNISSNIIGVGCSRFNDVQSYGWCHIVSPGQTHRHSTLWLFLITKTMEQHHFSWVNQRCQWPFFFRELQVLEPVRGLDALELWIGLPQAGSASWNWGQPSTQRMVFVFSSGMKTTALYRWNTPKNCQRIRHLNGGLASFKKM